MTAGNQMLIKMRNIEENGITHEQSQECLRKSGIITANGKVTRKYKSLIRIKDERIGLKRDSSKGKKKSDD